MLYKMCDALGVKASEVVHQAAASKNNARFNPKSLLGVWTPLPCPEAFFHMQFSEGTYKHPDAHEPRYRLECDQSVCIQYGVQQRVA